MVEHPPIKEHLQRTVGRVALRGCGGAEWRRVDERQLLTQGPGSRQVVRGLSSCRHPSRRRIFSGRSCQPAIYAQGRSGPFSFASPTPAASAACALVIGGGLVSTAARVLRSSGEVEARRLASGALMHCGLLCLPCGVCFRPSRFRHHLHPAPAASTGKELAESRSNPAGFQLPSSDESCPVMPGARGNVPHPPVRAYSIALPPTTTQQRRHPSRHRWPMFVAASFRRVRWSASGVMSAMSAARFTGACHGRARVLIQKPVTAGAGCRLAPPPSKPIAH